MQLEYSSLKLIDHKAKNSYAYEIKEIQKGYQEMAKLTWAYQNYVLQLKVRLSSFLRNGIAESEYVQVKRGDIFYADLSPVIGSEQGGIRPVLIIQNDIEINTVLL